MKHSYKRAVEYRNSILERIDTLKAEREQAQKEIEALAKETTTPEALLKGTGAEFKRLKEAQQELNILNQRLEAIEEQGGAEGILKIDPRMIELANEVFEENRKKLEQLVEDKNVLLNRLSDIFGFIAELEQEVSAHNIEVARLEKQIDTFKTFMSVDIPQKVTYRFNGARFTNQYQAFFNDFRNLSDSWKRQKVERVINE